MKWQFEIDYEKLNQLALILRGGITGNNSGKRLTNKYGSSLEFADFRQYQPGDDIRRIDWSLYGRSSRLYTKLNRSEVDATLNVIIDGSKSMDFGIPHKGLRSMEIALSLCYMSLRAYDRVSVALGVKGIDNYLAPVYGERAYGKVLKFMETLTFENQGDLNSCLRSLKKFLRPKQVTLVFSDFLNEGGYQEGLNQLAQIQQDVWVFHVASPEEANPDFRGGLKLVDSESGKTKSIDLDYWTLNSYKETFKAHCDEIKGFCENRKFKYIYVDTTHNSLEIIHGLKSYIQSGKI